MYLCYEYCVSEGEYMYMYILYVSDYIYMYMCVR